MWIVVVALIAVVAGGSFFLFHKQYGPLNFTLMFKDAKQLRPGQFVVYRGVRIGEVKSVELDGPDNVRVRVQIEHQHAKLVYQEAVFKIEKPKFIDISGEMQVTVSDSGSTHTPITEDSVLRGQEGFFDELVKRGKELLQPEK
jgi:hypothetical protein